MDQDPRLRVQPSEQPHLVAVQEAKGAFWDAWPWIRTAWVADALGSPLPDEPFIACLLAYHRCLARELEDLR